MRVLVFGCKGQLGKDLVTLFGKDGPVHGADLPECDITDSASVTRLVQACLPDIVINAAAYTDVEKAEEDSATAFLVNDTGARNVARAAESVGAPVVFFSTDYVFDGAKRTAYLPEDELRPLGVYAESKAAGEKATMAANSHHFIIRTAWLYGPGGNNFVEKIIRAASARPELAVVQDELGSPTYTRDLAQATKALCATNAYGAYHAVNAGSCSRFEFAKAILELAGIKTKVRPCHASEFPTKARRPAYSVLSNAKLEAATGHVMRRWREALADYIYRRDKCK